MPVVVVAPISLVAVPLAALVAAVPEEIRPSQEQRIQAVEAADRATAQLLAVPEAPVSLLFVA